MALKTGTNVSEVPHEYRYYLGVVADWHLPGPPLKHGIAMKSAERARGDVLACSEVSGQIQRKLAARVLPHLVRSLKWMDEIAGVRLGVRSLTLAFSFVT